MEVNRSLVCPRVTHSVIMIGLTWSGSKTLQSTRRRIHVWPKRWYSSRMRTQSFWRWSRSFWRRCLKKQERSKTGLSTLMPIYAYWSSDTWVTKKLMSMMRSDLASITTILVQNLVERDNRVHREKSEDSIAQEEHFLLWFSNSGKAKTRERVRSKTKEFVATTKNGHHSLGCSNDK